MASQAATNAKRLEQHNRAVQSDALGHGLAGLTGLAAQSKRNSTLDAKARGRERA